MYIVAKTHQKRVIMSCLLANMKGMYLTISAKLVTISVKSRLSLIPIQKKMSQAKKSLFRGYRYIHVSFYPGFTVHALFINVILPFHRCSLPLEEETAALKKLYPRI